MNATDVHTVAEILGSIELFSKAVVQLPLHPYQLEPVRAVLDSCFSDKGLEFLWVFPRQSGKDEAVAQLCTYLLTLYHRKECDIIHVYPTKPQIPTGVERLERRLKNPWTKGRWWVKGRPQRRGLGSAGCAFLSGHPGAKSEGATASLLLIINEAQDQMSTIVERRFTPMRASTNATALYVGTVRTRSDLLWKKKKELERLQAQDGIKRVFVTSPDTVGAANPLYMAFVRERVRTMGRHHPIVCTEYFNEPIEAAAKLFPPRRQALMRGTHPRLTSPQKGEIYIAVIDVGGQDEAAVSPFAELDNPQRDYTLCTIVRVLLGATDIGPVFEAVDIFQDQGSRHFQELPNQPSLFSRLLAYLKHWRVAAVVCDSTGVGQGITDALIEAHPKPVFGFDFGKDHGKARLGSAFLALIETGRFRYFAKAEPGSACWWFFQQADQCGYELPEGRTIEKGLQWGVSNSAKTELPDGRTRLTHDDQLLSAALCAEADRLIREEIIELFVPTKSIIIEPPKEEPAEW
jgi:hypothetical protein